MAWLVLREIAVRRRLCKSAYKETILVVSMSPNLYEGKDGSFPISTKSKKCFVLNTFLVMQKSIWTSIGRGFFHASPVPVRFPVPFVLLGTVPVCFPVPFFSIGTRSSLRTAINDEGTVTHGNKRLYSRSFPLINILSRLYPVWYRSFP